MAKTIIKVSTNILVIGGGIVLTRLSDTFGWLGYVLIVVGVLGLLLAFFWNKLRWGRNKVREQIADLEIGGQIKALHRINEIDVALGNGTAIDNIRVLVKVVFNPTMSSLPINRFVLKVWGRELETQFPPTVIYKESKWEGFFEIPKDLEMHDTKAHLLVFVGNISHTSSEFPIPFEKKEMWKP